MDPVDVGTIGTPPTTATDAIPAEVKQAAGIRAWEGCTRMAGGVRR